MTDIWCKTKGMGNRFSTLTQYHSIITAHGVLAAITFLFIIPISVLIKRFRRASRESTTRHHAYLQVLAVGLTTVVFILGFLAVGPPRSLTNPHHGIGVAIYVLILLQAIGGRLIKNIRGRSLRVHLHRWSGRTIGLLGIAQVPLGLTLYGSPKYTFVLFALWMAFLVLLYFILSYRHDGERDYLVSGGRSEGGRSRVPDRKSSGGVFKWLAPLAAGAGAIALLKGRNKNKDQDRDRDRSRSRSHSRSRSRVRSRSRGHEVIRSRRGSPSYVEDEKYSEAPRKEGGFMKKALGVGAALGAGALAARFLGRRDKQSHDEEYSAVATDTPSRPSRLRRHRPAASEFSDYTEDPRDGGRRSPLLPPPNSGLDTTVLSATEPRRHPSRPMAPRRSHPGHSRVDSAYDDSEYSSYVSPSRRTEKKGGGMAKGLLAGLGMGWFAKKMTDMRGGREDDRSRYEEDDRRSGRHGSRYTADYPSPTRRQSRRPTGRPVAPPSGITTTASGLSEDSSMVEPHPPRGGYVAPRPGSPPAGGGSQPLPFPVTPPARRTSRSGSHSRSGPLDPVSMPPMPPDAHEILHDGSSAGRPQRRGSSRRRRDGEAAAAAAVAAASRLADEEGRRSGGSRATEPGQPVSVRVRLHEDRDRNITLRRLTEEEQAAAARREQRRRRNGSVSSLSGDESPSSRRYRRDPSSQRRAESAAERAVGSEPPAPLSPPNPAFARGRRPKDSAYYSGQPGPSGGAPAAGATVSSLGSLASPGSHGTWSAASPSPSGPGQDPADRRRRRRMERRDSSRQSHTVEFT